MLAISALLHISTLSTWDIIIIRGFYVLGIGGVINSAPAIAVFSLYYQQIALCIR